jgi:N-acetylglucosaminyl-diphospho-decaprenol L-rhamnosyltransferase
MVTVVMVSYNTRELTVQAITTLIQNCSLPFEIIVVDNASTDETVETVQNTFPDVKLIKNQQNVGFGMANNQGFELATNDLVLLLNTDAFIRQGCVEKLVDTIHSEPKIGVVGPRILNEDGTLQPSVHPFPGPLRAVLEYWWLERLFPSGTLLGSYRNWTYSIQSDVPWLIGACMLVRKSVIDETAGFSKEFFMYAEETDWQKRISDSGWRIVFTPKAECIHRGGASGGITDLRVRSEFFRSQDIYLQKHSGTLGFVLFRIILIGSLLVRILGWSAKSLVNRSTSTESKKRVNLFIWLLKRSSMDWSVLKHAA